MRLVVCSQRLVLLPPVTTVRSDTTIGADEVRAQELCESRGGRPGLPVPNSSYGLYGRKATLNLDGQTLLPADAQNHSGGASVTLNERMIIYNTRK